jgi:hypothetical protein
MHEGIAPPENTKTESEASLSYKFQRLREKLRNAIATGELSGKLPGERALAKRFHVNAKTLSKALTDLAAEGLLDRSIGRGTYVKGSIPVPASTKRWLLVCDPEQTKWDLVRLLRQSHSDVEFLTDTANVRPSFLNQFSAVIVLASPVPDAFVRSLLVRNVPVVLVGQEPRTYSTHAVLFDGPLAVSQISRDLLLAGHRSFAAVEPNRCTVVGDNIRQTAARYAPSAMVHSCLPHDAVSLANEGVTAFVCHDVNLAAEVKAQLEKFQIGVPDQVSVVAVGTTSDEQPVSGYFIPRAEKANAIAMLLNQHSTRPTTIWLAGKFVDRGTMATIGSDLRLESGDLHHANAI